MVKVNLYDLKKAIDKMVSDHEVGRDSMSDIVGVVEEGDKMYFKHHSEYNECTPNIYSVKLISVL